MTDEPAVATTTAASSQTTFQTLSRSGSVRSEYAASGAAVSTLISAVRPAELGTKMARE